MTTRYKNDATRQKPCNRLWSSEVEQSLLDDSMLATIYCKANCGFSERALFKRNVKKCPACKASGLSVRTLNGRNAPLAIETEKFALRIIQTAIDESSELVGRHFAKRGVICPPLGLKGNSGADIAILGRDISGPVPLEAIECLFEIKMSFIWNWHERNLSHPIADYDKHGGTPSIYRTDSILKATGKAAITRSYIGSESIPFVVVGNTPPPRGYRANVDGTVRSGLIQKWISLTPSPLIVEPTMEANQRNPKRTAGGFLRIDDIRELQNLLLTLLGRKRQYIGAMTDAEKVGKLIKSLNLERSAVEIGGEFLRRLPEANAISEI